MAISTKTGQKTKVGFKKGVSFEKKFMINNLGSKLKNIDGMNPGLAQHLMNSAKKYYKEQKIGKPKGSPTITKDNSKAGLSKKSKKKDS
tara:strand:+ start:273 stop:539 length:267 start_codon:yes stop_codon:yes gene_type:complete